MKLHLALLVVGTFISGCVSSRVSLRSVEAAESRWKAAALTDYAYDLDVNMQNPRVECGAQSIIEVRVRDSRTERFGSCDVSSERSLEAGSVPALFAFIRRLRREDVPLLEVRFNSSYGYPELISVTYSRWVTDTTVNYFVRDFRLEVD